jgi:hypothetical protein
LLVAVLQTLVAALVAPQAQSEVVVLQTLVDVVQSASCTHSHTPPEQALPAEQVFPHAPQSVVVVSPCTVPVLRSMQVPPQSVCPAGHWHWQVAVSRVMPPAQTTHWPPQISPTQAWQMLPAPQLVPLGQQTPPQKTWPAGQLHAPLAVLQVPAGQQDMYWVLPEPQNSKPAPQEQVEVAVLQLAVVGQQTPELLLGSPQKSVPALHEPQRPEASALPLSPRQTDPRTLLAQHGFAHEPLPVLVQPAEPWQPPPPAWQAKTGV